MGEEIEKPVVAEPCNHKGELEAVSASEAVIDIPFAVETRLDILRCKKCGEVVITNKD